jgi:ribose transport system ATP-binding protein
VGAGRTETIRCLFGLDRVKQGRVTVAGKPQVRAEYLTPRAALNYGLDLLSENRKEEGLAVNLPIYANITLSALGRLSKGGWVNLAAEQQQSDRWRRELNIKSHDSRQPASALSGGNQQKIAIARLLHQDGDVFFLDEPTRGIDVGSKAEIYRLIGQLAAQGKAIVVISSYLPELMGICDTLAVCTAANSPPSSPSATGPTIASCFSPRRGWWSRGEGLVVWTKDVVCDRPARPKLSWTSSTTLFRAVILKGTS